MGARNLPTGLATALAAVEVAPVFLVELDWPTGTVYAWNGYANLVWNSITWIGLGHMATISEIKESSDLGANGVVLTLSGLPAAEVAEALDGQAQGCSAKIYFGVINGSGFSLDPYLVFDGFIDNANIVCDGMNSTITINLQNEFIDNRSSARRLTHEDQQLDYPGDMGLQYVATLANQQFTWGKATVYPAGGPGGGGDDNNGEAT